MNSLTFFPVSSWAHFARLYPGDPYFGPDKYLLRIRTDRKNIFKIRADKLQTKSRFCLVQTINRKFLYGFGRKSGPDLNLYAVCPPPEFI